MATKLLQTEVQQGLKVLPGAASLFGATPAVPLDDINGRMAAWSGTSVDLAAAASTPQYVIVDHSIADNTLTCKPLMKGGRYRIRLSAGGAIAAGDQLEAAANGEAVEAAANPVIGTVEEGAAAGGGPLVLGA